MKTVTLTENVTLSDDTRVIKMSISSIDIMVDLDYLHRPKWDPCTEMVPWGQLDDVDYLYKLFEEEPVKVFKRICEMLAQINTNRHIYEVLV